MVFCSILPHRSPLKELLGNFSLVHSRFRAAAEGATVFTHEFSLVAPWGYEESSEDDDWCYDFDNPRPGYRERCCEQFSEWLPCHSPHVTRLQLTNFNKTFDKFPPNLRELDLGGCGVQQHYEKECRVAHTFRRPWGPGEHLMKDCTTLTKLHLSACFYTRTTLREVAVCASLKHLSISCPEHELDSCDVGSWVYSAIEDDSSSSRISGPEQPVDAVELLLGLEAFGSSGGPTTPGDCLQDSSSRRLCL